MTSHRTYHHGDLRHAVLAAALDVIATDGPSALSLRDLARRAGVSHAAPAHHFKDRAGLLTAIAVEGHTLLAQTMADTQDLSDLGVRYVRFATRHPAHFQVMFQPELLRGDDPELVAAQARTSRRLHESVAAGNATDPELAHTAAWSLAHGFATLLLTGNLDHLLGDRTPEEIFRATVGLQPGPRS
ncbi:TetR/AcrR family transcriptional regulator [Streptomyces sp. NPDC048442]|uniref:TetR/AcrR family transcriptional regulator n=1 Tax=Streptomyces sp. NPDC048442 TaxID=3154823 RepID=UPI00341AB311